MLDAPLFQKRIPGFCADAQYLAHLVDVQHIRVIPEHHTVRITGIQIFLTQTDFPFPDSYFPDPMPDCISGFFNLRHLPLTGHPHKTVDALFINGEDLFQQHHRRTAERRVLLNENMGGLVWLFGDF